MNKTLDYISFNDLNLNEKLLKSIEELNYKKPTEVQRIIIPIILNADYNKQNNNNLLIISKTGSGKTASYLFPLLNRIILNKKNNSNNVFSIIIAPTRELLEQIYYFTKNYIKYLTDEIDVIYSHGGFDIKNEGNKFKSFKRGIIIGTPKRIIDLIELELIKIDNIDSLVIDEMDLIIEKNIKNYLKNLFKLLPKKRNNFFFSATKNNIEINEIKKILNLKLIKEISINNDLNNKDNNRDNKNNKNNKDNKDNTKQKNIELNNINQNNIKQYIYYVKEENKFKLLLEVLNEEKIKKALIFLNNNKEIDNLIRFLKNNNIIAGAIHSNKSNSHRIKILNKFNSGELKYLVASNIISRGLDIIDLEYVVNFEIPTKINEYIHRIGRVGRMGKTGFIINFCSIKEKHSIDKLSKLFEMKNIIHKYYLNLDKIKNKTMKKNQNKKSNKFNKSNNINNFRKNKKILKFKPNSNLVDFSKWKE